MSGNQSHLHLLMHWQRVNTNASIHMVQENVGCSQTFLASLSYSQVAGLFLGMVVVGFTVDRIGRRAGSIFTALIMTIGIDIPNTDCNHVNASIVAPIHMLHLMARLCCLSAVLPPVGWKGL